MQIKLLSCVGVGETQPVVVQTETGVADCVEHIRCEAVRKKIEKNALVGVVKLITEYGMSTVSEVYSYLVGASCNRLDL